MRDDPIARWTERASREALERLAGEVGARLEPDGARLEAGGVELVIEVLSDYDATSEAARYQGHAVPFHVLSVTAELDGAPATLALASRGELHRSFRERGFGRPARAEPALDAVGTPAAFVRAWAADPALAAAFTGAPRPQVAATQARVRAAVSVARPEELSAERLDTLITIVTRTAHHARTEHR